jgi:phosphatidylinositol alpha-1,6-mannosyltransferase
VPGLENADGPIVLTVARLLRADRYKGVDTLLRAWPAVVEAVPGATLAIVGDGDDRADMEALAEAGGTGPSVRFLGRLSDDALADCYERASLFALPGRVRLGPEPEGEGLGLVFLEAAAAGLPVVAGRAGGAVEAVDDGRTGFLVDPESPAAVADGIVALLVDPSRATAMGRAGQAMVVDRFGAERFDAEVGRLLAELGSWPR